MQLRSSVPEIFTLSNVTLAKSTLHHRAAQVDAGHVGIVEAGKDRLAGALVERVEDLDPDQLGATEGRAEQDRTGEICPAEAGLVEIRLAEIGADEAGEQQLALVK